MLRHLLHRLHLVNTQVIEEFENEAKKKGIAKASRDLLKSLDVEVVGEEFSSKGPILFISNHIGGLDSHALMSKIHRDDYKIVALSTYHVFGPEYSKRLLPIYRKKYWNHAFFEYPLNIRLDTTVQHLVDDEIRLKNRTIIRAAAEWISKGGAVSIFPQGSVGKGVAGGSWKAGVGHLVSQINNPKARIVFARIDGSHGSDLVRYVRGDLRKMFFQRKTLRVSFSKPMPIIKGETPKDTVVQLEQMYMNFST